MRITLHKITQPIGVFYISALPAKTVLQISEVRQRKFDTQKLITFGGPQRAESPHRIREIAEYCSDPDATFPTAIIIAINSDKIISFDGHDLEFDETKKIGEIIDGQHRIKGLSGSGSMENFDLPVVFMFDLTEYEKAYVFSIINSKQTKVSMSLIYDLFELSEDRSPYKTCHEIARLLNSDKTSPFYTKLKMLGVKETGQASLSQGTFVKYSLPLLSKNPDKDTIDIKSKVKLEDDPRCPLRTYFIENKDEVIYKILFNLFSGVKEVFLSEWEDPNNYVLSKTTGYGGILHAFNELYAMGKKQHNLSKEYFTSQFLKVKETLLLQHKKLTSEDFGTGHAEEQNLANLIKESIVPKT